MARTYDIIDSDGHVLEPLTMWEEYIDPDYRDRAPKVVHRDGGRYLTLGQLLVDLGVAGIGRAGAALARDQGIDDDAIYENGRLGGFDPHARILDLDLDNIDATVLYPTVGLKLVSLDDPVLASKLCRAVNRWMADYCAAYADRLFGMAVLPMQSVELAVEELRFARNELGMTGALLRPTSTDAKMFHDPMWEPLWSAAEELDAPISLHEAGAASGVQRPGVERFFDSHGARHIVSHTVEMMLAQVSLIWYGVFERHPNLRVGFMESGGGWVPGWLERMDRHFDDKAMNDSQSSVRPTEVFQRNCWASFEPVEGSLKVLADYLGPSKVLWATDYPHVDGFFPGAPKRIADLGMSPETTKGVLAGGAMAYYGIK